MSQSLPNLLSETVEKIRATVDANTVIGEAITTPDGVTILPVSRIKLGFAGGGADLAPKTARPSAENNFGGGTGGAVTVTPVAFLVIKDGMVRTIQLSDPSNSIDRALTMLPELVDKLMTLIPDTKAEKAEEPNTEPQE